MNVADDKEKGTESGEHTEVNFQGELDGSAEGALPGLLEKLDETNTNEDSMAQRMAKERKKRQAEEKKKHREKEVAKKRRTDMGFRAQEWLKHIKSDITKIKETLGDRQHLEDKTLKNLYNMKFAEYDHNLTAYRGKFEEATARGSPVQRKEIKAAEAVIKKAKEDLGVLKKLKPKQIK